MLSSAAGLVGNGVVLLTVAVTSSVASLASFGAARAGLVIHKAPRVMLGITVAALAITYWLEVFRVIGNPVAADMRRLIGPALYLAIMWGALVGRKFWRREVWLVRSIQHPDVDPEGK